jgi:hypothetical protein
MLANKISWRYGIVALAIATLISLGSDRAADLNPAALQYQLPNQIHWTADPKTGDETAAVMGDVNKPGLYVVLVKWTPHHMSRPHFHANDRFITVLSGTWWVGTGAKYDPDSTVAMPTGTFVTHFKNQIHYDGAKDQETVLEIVGEGPAPSVPAEQK